MTRRNAVPAAHNHSHLWVVGILGIAAGLALMVYVPSLAAVSHAVVLFAGFHLVGAIVVLASVYVTGGKGLARPLAALAGKDAAERIDFGWAPAWIHGPWIAALIALATAVVVQVAAPGYWPVATALTLVAATSFAGHLFAKASARYDGAVLPMVDLVSGGQGLVLDAGCGAGRTTLAVGRAYSQVSMVAVDRFDSGYIDGGGRLLLERNLRLAGLEQRVRIERGDLTSLPFAADGFDAVVSAHAVDHLGGATEEGLREVRRVLKPGGRFLLVVWVPGWAMFAVANVMSFFLRPKRDWRRLTERAGFEVADEGMFNGVSYLLLRKPLT